MVVGQMPKSHGFIDDLENKTKTEQVEKPLKQQLRSTWTNGLVIYAPANHSVMEDFLPLL